MRLWLIEESIGQRLARAVSKSSAPTTEQMHALEQHASLREGLPRNMRVAGTSAEVRIDGVLTKKPDWYAFAYGGGNTTYESIVTALAIAAADASVKDVVLWIDSPGGEVDGLFEAFAAIRAFKAESGKKLSVRAAKALSAAYGIAAAAGPIAATTPAAMFGSVGTAIDYVLWDAVEYVSLTNTDSPDKRPDITTDAGKAVVVRFLDKVNALFVDEIAGGRGVEPREVLETFGRGATVLAGEAKRLGMIDAAPKVASSSSAAKAQSTPGGAGAQEKTPMKLDELRAQHPDAFAAAVAEGIKAERDRVVAHLTMAKSSGDTQTAYAAIESGDGMTATIQAKYMSAAINRSDRGLRQQEANAAAAIVDGAQPAPAARDLGDQLADLVLGEKDGAK